MDERENEYWFSAKRYGWGWGPPATWQGWLVLLGYIAAVYSGSFLLPPDQHPYLFGTWIALATAAFLTIAWLKGEPPRWPWGK